MDPFHRLIRLQIWLIFGIILGGFTAAAYAETIPATSTTVTRYASAHVQDHLSLAAACQAEAPYAGKIYHSVGSDGFCMYMHATAGLLSYAFAYPYQTAGYVCPVNQNWSLSGTSCTRPDCVLPQVRQADGTCSVNCPVAGSNAMTNGVTAWGGSSCNSSSCSSGLSVQGCALSCSSGVSGGGSCSCTGCKFTGSPSVAGALSATPITAEPLNPEPPSPEGCLANGQSFITMSGTTVCVAPSSPGAPPIEKKDESLQEKVNPDGTTTETETTETQTINPDGTITVTTTTTSNTLDSSGNPVGTPASTITTTTQPPSKFCEENPESSICKKGAWGGACGAFLCDGDPVQCATAQAVWKSQCDFEKMNEPSTLSDLGNAAASGNDTSLQQLTEGTVVDVQGAFNSAQGRWLSGSLPPVSFSVLGVGYSLDTSFLAQFMQAIGYILVSIAGVVGIRIIGGQQT